MIKIQKSIQEQWRDEEKKEMGVVKYYAKYYGIPFILKTAEFWIFIQVMKVIAKVIIK